MVIDNSKPYVGWGGKRDWPTVGSRVRPEIAEKLKEKYAERGQRSALIHALLTKFFEGKILGIKLEGF
jgi:hypothetical protein